MYYESTRGLKPKFNSAQAIKAGICEDGGLFVPETIPEISQEFIKDLINLDYKQIAYKVLSLYLKDFSEDELKDCINKAYDSEKFTSERIAPVVGINKIASILELWHGPTCAFKDMALQILPHFMVKSLQKTNENKEIVILVATSGDTGKAALEGFKDIAGTKVVVFFPNKGVSEIQRLQMITQKGGNLNSIAINGNFDDAQNGVKEIFTDKDFIEDFLSKGVKFSSANSINWGRLAPQIVYYFSSYIDMVKSNKIQFGEKINFVVPTGNFGNILAGYYAKQMGLPINKLICAANDNNVLSEFLKSGIYNSKKDLKKTISPSMDILVSSNLERLLYELTDRDSSLIRIWMEKLKEKSEYKIDEDTKRKIHDLFWANYSTEEETYKTIGHMYDEYRYVSDTHTAVAIDVYEKYVISTADMTKTVIVSTASPFKFNSSVVKGIFGEDKIKNKSENDLLSLLSVECNVNIPNSLKDLDKKDILHKLIINKEDMKKILTGIL